MTAIIQTIEDMEKIYYTAGGQSFLTPDDLQSPFIAKDAPVITTTTGAYNAVYGAQAWVQLNQEANTFGALPKVPWGNRSGFRAITARANTRPYGGTAEAATLPASIKPTIAEVSAKPKTSVSIFENSEVQEALVAAGSDDTFGSMVDLKQYMAAEFAEDINAQLNTQNGTLASNNFESIDRVVGSYAEVANCKENDESTAYTADDVDIYSLNRDAAAAWHDAYVNHNSSTVHSLTDSILQALVQNTLSNGANPAGQFFQTGYDTWAVINQLYDPAVRYNLIGATNIQPSVNGIKTQQGVSVGTNVATLFDKPVIISKDTVKDTGGISRLYLLDTSNTQGFDYPRLGVKILKPVQYFEAGMNAGSPFAVNKLSNKGMYRMMGELMCTFFGAQGKARDLKA